MFPGDTVYYYGENKSKWGQEYTVYENKSVTRLDNQWHVNTYTGGSAAFRLKPQLVIGGRLVPMPEREAPAVGTTLFTPAPHGEDYYNTYSWSGDKWDLSWLERGLVHLTKEAAVAHGEALVALSKKKKD